MYEHWKNTVQNIYIFLTLDIASNTSTEAQMIILFQSVYPGPQKSIVISIFLIPIYTKFST